MACVAWQMIIAASIDGCSLPADGLTAWGGVVCVCVCVCCVFPFLFIRFLVPVRTFLAPIGSVRAARDGGFHRTRVLLIRMSVLCCVVCLRCSIGHSQRPDLFVAPRGWLAGDHSVPSVDISGETALPSYD